MEADGITVVVVGGGLVGCLQACYMAKRGFKVKLFEKREDIRKLKHVVGRSINLAISVRGISALQEVGLDAVVLSSVIPMYGRMIHDVDGKCWPYPYGCADQCINSVDRRKLNEILLTQAESFDNVEIFFNHKLLKCNYDKNEITFLSGDEKVKCSYSFICGCDGAYSVVRQEMTKKTRINFSQEYIPHGYVEICMPPKKTSTGEEFAMATNYLHIWPRNEFMMIGLPNQDKSFTGTLFMPFDKFRTLITRTDALEFFEEVFPDSIDLFGKENLLSTFEEWNAQPLISIRCDPFHFEDKCIIMGDAAHAMVPFYGQGMNCGMEDCLVFKDALDKHNNDLEAAFSEYSKNRAVDAHAICELAMYNYTEMRASVNSKMFMLRRKLDTLLHKLMPYYWIPLYTTVSFTRIPYHECIKNKAWQDKILRNIIDGSLITGAVLAIYGALKYSQIDPIQRLTRLWD